jgi:hypothetical protein
MKASPLVPRIPVKVLTDGEEHRLAVLGGGPVRPAQLDEVPVRQLMSAGYWC